MTTGQFREVDHDLLADYVGGALAGTSDEAVVAQLIAEYPAWKQAYADLTLAVGRVSDVLADWGAAELATPPDITARLTGALAAAADGAAPEPPLRDPVRVPGQSRRPGTTTGPTPAGPNRPPAGGSRRQARWVGPITIAAAVAAFAGLGANQLDWFGSGSDAGAANSGSDAGPAEGQNHADVLLAPESAPPAFPAPLSEKVSVSGTDYAPATLSDAVNALPEPTSATTDAREQASTLPSEEDVPPGLERLVDHDALATCLGAVADEHNHGPVHVNLVDYATFQRTPALVIIFIDGTATRWTWAAGPDCGKSGSGADTRHSARVG
ncbi:MAG TPA: hypothetical protein VFX60_05105 [Micromonospora sp.]|nr:hypothetical protein [Micromonospora sp.]